MPLKKKSFFKQVKIEQGFSTWQFKFESDLAANGDTVLHVDVGTIRTKLGQEIFNIDLTKENISLDSLTTLTWRWKIKDTQSSDGIIIRIGINKTRLRVASHSRYTFSYIILCNEKSSVWNSHKINISLALSRYSNGQSQPANKITGVSFLTMESHDQEFWLSQLKFSKEQPEASEKVINNQIIGKRINKSSIAKSESACLVDTDKDGDLDLYAVNQNGLNYLRSNDGQGNFNGHHYLYSASPSLKNIHAIFVDLNNDGWPDLYEGRELSENKLFINHGDLKFTEAEELLGKDNIIPNTYATLWGFFNKDKQCDFFEISPNALNYSDNLLRLFVRKEEKYSYKTLSHAMAYFGGAAADFNNDGRLEIFLANNHGENLLLYLNDSLQVVPLPDSVYLDEFDSTKLSNGNNGYRNSEGAVFADFNKDGSLDIYLGNDGQPNQLYMGDGLQFKEQANIRNTADSLASEGFLIADFDNDMDWDIYLLHTYTQNCLLLNNGEGFFYDGTAGSGLEDPGGAMGAACGDIDNDGDIDIVLADPYRGIRILKNKTNTNSYIKLNLRGQPANYFGIRSKVYIYKEQPQSDQKELVCMHQLPCGDGFQFQAFSQQFHFGLQSGYLYTMKTIFPDGVVVQKSGISSGQTVTLLYPRKNFLLKFADVIAFRIQEPLFTWFRSQTLALFIFSIILIGLIVNGFKSYFITNRKLSVLSALLFVLVILIFTFPFRTIGWPIILLLSMTTVFFSEIFIYPAQRLLHHYYVREASWDKLFDHLKAFHHGGVAINSLDRLIFLFQNLPQYKGEFVLYQKRIDDACRIYNNQTSWQISELAYILKELKWNRAVVRKLTRWRNSLLKQCNYEQEKNRDRNILEGRIRRVVTLVKNIQVEIENIYRQILPHFRCEVIQTIRDVYRIKFADHSITIRTEIPENTLVLIKGFELGNIVADLIENGIRACKHREDYQGIIEIKEENGFILVDVIDNGKGIPRNLHKKIFEKGFTRTENGSGFGLYYARETVSRYGGNIEIYKTKVGKGSTMRLSLNKAKVYE